MSIMEKIGLAFFALQTSGIVNKVFGSIGALIDLAQGKVPACRIIDLLFEDEKARSFVLQCVSEAVSYNSKRYNKPADDDTFWISPMDDVLYDRIMRLKDDERMKLDSLISNKAVLDSALSDPATVRGAKYVLKRIRETENGSPAYKRN